MDLIRDGRVVHSTLNVVVNGNAVNVPGRVNAAVSLDGSSNQYIYVADQYRSWFGNLAMNRHGTTGSMWVNFKRFNENSYYLSRGGLTMYYAGGKLYVQADVSGRRWEVSVGGLQADAWMFLEYTWHPDKGLQVRTD